MITLTPIGIDALDGRQPASVLLRRVAGPLGGNVLRHEDGALQGVARLGAEDESGIAVGILEGVSAVTGAAAAIRIEFDDAGEWPWSVDRLKALRPI